MRDSYAASFAKPPCGLTAAYAAVLLMRRRSTHPSSCSQNHASMVSAPNKMDGGTVLAKSTGNMRVCVLYCVNDCKCLLSQKKR